MATLLDRSFPPFRMTGCWDDSEEEVLHGSEGHGSPREQPELGAAASTQREEDTKGKKLCDLCVSVFVPPTTTDAE